MYIFIANLDKDAAGLGKQIPGNHQSVTQVGKIRMYAQLPGIPERFYLLRLPGGIFGATIFYISLAGTYLPVGAKLNAVGGSMYIICTLPFSPSFSASEVITSRLSPRIMRLAQRSSWA